ncbi:cytochrome P450 [Mycobacterium sp. pV006]|uniref:cytochrome P450 n=1 Tax=Mycobacterium sp. pV006 TaxID=3238983 RepID=UPI00351B0841
MTVQTGVRNVFDAGLPTLDYDLTATPADVRADLYAAQQQAPVAIGPAGPEVLSYELARHVLRDTRFAPPPGINLTMVGVTSGPLFDKVMGSLLCLHGEEHQRLRRLVSREFTPRAVARLRPTVDEVVNGLVDDVVEAGRCDVVTDIARPYPVPIICALLGAPREDWQRFSDWTHTVFQAFSFSTNIVENQDVVMAAWNELDDFIDDMIARRRRTLTDDLLSDLIRAEEDGDRLSTAELRMLAAGLLMAGTDTTRHQLAASVQALCEHPEQWAQLRDDPELAMSAVEETMRHSPAVCGTPRTVLQDAEIAGLRFPAGTFVLVNTFAANRDPACYDDPERLDLRRSAPPPILTFGGGAHYCLGANLARLELAHALVILARRLPGLRIAGDAPWDPILGMTGPTTLPVEFGG